MEPNFPTLIYPNGDEIITSGEVLIQWSPPVVFDLDSRIIFYEIYYTDQYDPNNEPDWKQIAVLPETTDQFVWHFSSGIRSTKCRVAICSRNSRGEKSRFSISADDFSINRKKLTQPVVLSPVSNESYDKTIQITTDDSAILGTYSARSFYQFYFSSVTANIPNTVIAQNIPIGSGPFVWNTINLKPAEDYVIQVFLADDNGNVSDSTFIRDVSISHEGFFIIDTTPPEASIIINNNDTFTRQQDVTIQIASYDATTGVHSLLFQENSTSTTPQAPADVKHYTLSNGDDVKIVSMLSQDFGGNRNFGITQRTFDTDIEFEEGSVADSAIDPVTGTVWAVGSNQLYKITAFPSLVTTLDDTPTAIAIFGGFVYIATNSSDGLGSLLRYNGFVIEDVNDFTSSDSTINAMTVHGILLFLGMENGFVYSFDGATIRLVGNVSNPVKTLMSDGNLLYLTERNGSDVFIYTGSEFISAGAING